MRGLESTFDTAREGQLRAASPEGTDLLARLARVGVESKLFGDPAAAIRVGRYDIVDEIGTGGMGVVYRARDPELNRDIALKLVHPTGVGTRDPEHARSRLLREARAMAQLSHPNVVTVHEVGTFEDQVYVAMEFVEGRTLATWLADETRDWHDVLGRYIDAARGLAAAHEQGIVHRDFKPENVMLGASGRVRVLDFGLARPVDAPPDRPAKPVGSPHNLSLTRTGAIVGTPAYMAPEQYRGRPADAKSDQFSFCVALWEALYGERPFRGTTLAALAEAVQSGDPPAPPEGRRRPAWLRRTLTHGLAVHPADRYPSMNDLIDALRAGLRESRLRRWAPALAGVAALGVAGVLLAAQPEETPPGEPVPGKEVKILVPVPHPLEVEMRSEPEPDQAEAAPEPPTARKTRTPAKPKYKHKVCYLAEDGDLRLGTSKSPKSKKEYRGTCYTCRGDGHQGALRDKDGRSCEKFMTCHSPRPCEK